MRKAFLREPEAGSERGGETGGAAFSGRGPSRALTPALTAGVASQGASSGCRRSAGSRSGASLRAAGRSEPPLQSRLWPLCAGEAPGPGFPRARLGGARGPKGEAQQPESLWRVRTVGGACGFWPRLRPLLPPGHPGPGQVLPQTQPGAPFWAPGGGARGPPPLGEPVLRRRGGPLQRQLLGERLLRVLECSLHF